jgi:hypothetical protein
MLPPSGFERRASSTWSWKGLRPLVLVAVPTATAAAVACGGGGGAVGSHARVRCVASYRGGERFMARFIAFVGAALSRRPARSSAGWSTSRATKGGFWLPASWRWWRRRRASAAVAGRRRSTNINRNQKTTKPTANTRPWCVTWMLLVLLGSTRRS